MSRRTSSSINAEICLLDTQIQTFQRRETDFQRLIDDLQKLKDEVSDERKVAEAKRNELEAQKVPINWIPTELLIQIFLSYTDFDFEEPTYRPPVVISHVCSRWRNIALSTPHLWKRITLEGIDKRDVAQTFLKRSEAVLLEIHYSTAPKASPTEETYQMVKFLSNFSQHFRRVESLSLQCKAALALVYILPSINDHLKDFPRLRHLNLAITTENPSFIEAPNLLDKEQDIPKEVELSKPILPSDSRLVRLQLEQVPIFNFPVAFIENLRSLELSYSPRKQSSRDYYYLKMSSLCRFLALTPRLEELILVNTVPYFDVRLPDGATADNADHTLIEMKPVRLNHLKSIDWTWPYTGDVHRFLSMIDAPAMEKLDLWVEDLAQKRNDTLFLRGYTSPLSPHRFIRSIVNYPSLRDLSLQCAGEDTTSSVLRKFSFPALEKVAFTNVVPAARIGENRLPVLSIFPRLESIFRDPRLPNVTHLTLSHFKICPEAGRVEAMFGYMPVLTSLSLDSCLGVGRLMEGLQEQQIGASKPNHIFGTAGGGREGKEASRGVGGNRPRRGVKFCPRLEALSFWGCQDVDFASLRAVVNSRNRSINGFAADELSTFKGVSHPPNGAIQTITRGPQDRNTGAGVHGHTTTEVAKMGRKIKPLRKVRRQAAQLGEPMPSGAEGAAEAPSANITSSIVAMQEAFQPASIIYLRVANCKLIPQEEAISLRDRGVVDVIWAGSD
ncbi:hypothetical protein GALMADRAFT_251813 [Galerina marginata CBS 339.88]|uniref:F-box domain-containing protein n=1 Tax=Galerina marginata (strain CBS 339.88) TaxID=685588 RepID=A0A067SQQ4_GALM3|nr:hypothetical protein GALMADRAFT_251813 [Galerina marginata CBS 339.88]